MAAASWLDRVSVVRGLTVSFVVLVIAGAETAHAQTFDPGFNAAANGLVKAVAVQPDGKVLIGGDFSQVNGVTRRRLARLNADGSLDTAFTTDIPNPIVTHDVSQIALLPDGRIIVAGGFAQIGGVTQPLLACLLPDGAVDTTFTPSVPDLVQAIFVQPDGRIVIGGRFLTINGVTRSRVARLNPDGTLDGAFAPAVTGFVFAIAQEADGSLLLGGSISAVNGVARSGLARVSSGGTLDTAFSVTIDRPNAEWIEAIAVRPDGRILIGGVFETVNGVPARTSRRSIRTAPSTRALTPGPTPTARPTTASSTPWFSSLTAGWSSAADSCASTAFPPTR